MDKPAMAESTLVKGTDMIALGVSCSDGRRWGEKRREREKEGKALESR
jgi:hypothetical protein